MVELITHPPTPANQPTIPGYPTTSRRSWTTGRRFCNYKTFPPHVCPANPEPWIAVFFSRCSPVSRNRYVVSRVFGRPCHTCTRACASHTCTPACMCHVACVHTCTHTHTHTRDAPHKRPYTQTPEGHSHRTTISDRPSQQPLISPAPPRGRTKALRPVSPPVPVPQGLQNRRGTGDPVGVFRRGNGERAPGRHHPHGLKL